MLGALPSLEARPSFGLSFDGASPLSLTDLALDALRNEEKVNGQTRGADGVVAQGPSRTPGIIRGVPRLAAPWSPRRCPLALRASFLLGDTAF